MRTANRMFTMAASVRFALTSLPSFFAIWRGPARRGAGPLSAARPGVAPVP